MLKMIYILSVSLLSTENISPFLRNMNYEFLDSQGYTQGNPVLKIKKEGRRTTVLHAYQNLIQRRNS